MWRSSIAGRKGRYDRLPALAADLVRRKWPSLPWTHRCGAGSQGSDNDYSDRLRERCRSGQVRTCHQPQPAGQQPYRRDFLIRRAGRQATCSCCTGLVPQTLHVALLVNPNNPVAEGTECQDVQAAARTLGLKLDGPERSQRARHRCGVRNARPTAGRRARVASDSFFFSQREQIVALAERHRLPTIYPWREFAAAGGLMSYGTSLTDAYRQAGVYVGRILKGEKPADLPVSSRRNSSWSSISRPPRRSASTVPPTLLAAADEVIE